MITRAQTASSRNSNTIGVLNDTEVLLVGVRQGKSVLHSILVPSDVSELGGLLEFIWQEQLSSVWVMPGTTLSRIATCAWIEQASHRWVVVTHRDPHEPTRPICAVLWPKGSGQREVRRLTFVFPEYAGWGWVLPNARSLLATVTYLEQALGRPVIDSPNLVAHQLLTDLTRDHSSSWLRSSPLDLHAVSSRDGSTIPVMESARDLAWMRPLTLAEQRQRYLHKYTHLSWGLEACTTIQLGTGAPEYSSNGRAFDGVRPGIWRVRAERAGSIFDGRRLPRCLDEEWMSTPQVKCCQDISYHVDVRERYYWSQSHELLTGWARTLWQAGERLHTHPHSYRHVQGRANASHTITLLAQRGMAILAKEEAKAGWARPDWWAQIVGRSRAILVTHLASLARKGIMPVLVDRESLWVVSDDANPLTAVPGLVTAQRWRGYRVGYEVALPLSTEIKAAFRAAEFPDQFAMALDISAGEISP